MPDDIEMLAAALKRAGDSESTAQFYEHTYWTNVAAKILAAGYAIVKLPDGVAAKGWLSIWPLEDIGPRASVFVIESGSPITINGVGYHLEKPEHALSLAAALIAAARNAQEQADG